MTTYELDTHTESAGTLIQDVIPAAAPGVTCLDRFEYIAGATAHTLTVLRPIGDTTTTQSSSSGTNTLTLASVDFGKSTANVEEELAANDYLIWINQWGGYDFDYVASVSGSVVTMNSNLPTDVANGATVWGCYEIGRSTHSSYTLPASATTKIESCIKSGFSVQSGVQTSRSGSGDPLLISINNATNAGTMTYAMASYRDASDLGL